MSIIPTWALILVAVLSLAVAIMPPKWLNPMISHLNRVFKSALAFKGESGSDDANDDQRAECVISGNGERTTERILKIEDLDELDQIFGDIMALPPDHRHKTEKVFAAYWLKRGKLESKRLDEAWGAVALAAVTHSKGNADNDHDPRFSHRVYRENLTDVQTRIFPETADAETPIGAS